MLTTLKQPPKRRHPARKESRLRTSGATPVYITAVSVMGSGLTLTFDQPVLLRGTPGFTTNVAGAVPLSAQKQAANRVLIIFSSALAGVNCVYLPYRDPAIRNVSGGYVTSNRFAV